MSEKKKMMDEFTRGYICACATMLHGHGDDTMIREALRAIGFNKIDLSLIDSFDKEALRRHGYIPRGRKTQ